MVRVVGESVKVLPRSDYRMDVCATLNSTGTKQRGSAGKSSRLSVFLRETAMSQQKISKSKFVVCLQNEQYPASLEIGKIYRTVPDAPAAKNHFLRIVDESGEDYLYPAGYFAAIALPVSVSRRLRMLTLRRRSRKGEPAPKNLRRKSSAKRSAATS
jgi:hypothetical protein